VIIILVAITMAFLKLLSTARCVNTPLIFRGYKTVSMPDQRAEFEKYKQDDVLSDPDCQDVLSRVKVVTDVTESKDIVNKMLAMGKPIAVDMEGIVEDTVSMVQVRDVKRNITLFRTGVNPSLYWEGGLAELLETPSLKKIMHGSTVDCIATYRDGVKLWNLYDTAVAYRVLDYQLHGNSIFGSNGIGFNSLCGYFDVKENPVKDRFRNILWKMMIKKDGKKKGIDTTEVLDDEMLLYCAWDVDPLHNLHDLLNSAIDPAYSHLVKQVSEIEIIRAIDSQLAKQKRNNLKNMELCNIFLSNLPQTLTPPHLYSSLLPIQGHKHIYFSHTHRSANIILDSREEAVLAQKNFKNWGSKLGKKAKSKLVIEDYGNTAEILENSESAVQSEDENSISYSNCKIIVKSLMESKCPVVVDFLQSPVNNTCFLELYAGTNESIKILISQEMVNLGDLGTFLSSDIVKIVPRLELGPFYMSMRLLSILKVQVNNVFEISTAVKSLDYLEHGQSLFKQEAMSVKNMSLYLGLPMGPNTPTSKQHFYYMAYLHLSEIIPQYFQKCLSELAALEVGVGSTDDATTFRQKRKRFKTRLDGHCLHLRLIGEKKAKVSLQKQKKLKDMVTSILLSKNMSVVDYNSMGRCVVVELENGQAVKTLMEELEKLDQSPDMRFKVSHPMVLQSMIEKPPKADLDMNILQQKLESNVEKLKSNGFPDNL